MIPTEFSKVKAGDTLQGRSAHYRNLVPVNVLSVLPDGVLGRWATDNQATDTATSPMFFSWAALVAPPAPKAVPGQLYNNGGILCVGLKSGRVFVTMSNSIKDFDPITYKEYSMEAP